MTIIRDGVEIKLTQEELRKAYYIKHIEYLMEDVAAKIEDEFDLDDDGLSVIVERFEHELEHNDGYWGYYWSIMEYVINEYIKEIKKQ